MQETEEFQELLMAFFSFAKVGKILSAGSFYYSHFKEQLLSPSAGILPENHSRPVNTELSITHRP